MPADLANDLIMIGHLVVDEGEGVITGATRVWTHKETSISLSHLL